MYYKAWLRDRWQALSTRPFFRLFLHCTDRIFYGGEGADTGEVDIGIGAVLALLSAPGAFVAVGLLLFKYSPLLHYLTHVTHFDAYLVSFPDEYFFSVLSLTAAGAMAVWKWDSLVPDRRDYGNLAHLPIPAGHIFLANLLALLFLAAVVSVDINLGSSLLFPLVACWTATSTGYIVVFFVTHLLSVVLAAVFGFMAVLAILGVLMALLPYRAFRKCSVYVRSALLIFFVALLMTSTSEPKKLDAARSAISWTHVPPTAWFAALCQWLRGIRNPLFGPLSDTAIFGSIAVLFVAIGSYALSYRRCFLRSAETIVVLPAGGGVIARFVLRVLDGCLLRSPFQRGGFRFVIKALFRSETHSLTWIAFTAVGVMIASNNLLLANSGPGPASTLPSTVVLGVPLVLTYFLMLGVRAAFEIPSPLRSNWTFRFGVDPATRELTALAKRVMIAFEVPLLIASFAVFAYFWGWRIASIHSVLIVAMALLLIETLVFSFRKIPFTCSAPPFKQTTIVSVIVYLIGLSGFSAVIPALESQSLHDPVSSSAFIVILLLLWWFCLYAARKNQIEPDRRLIFEDALPPAVEVLDLTFRR
ncbi:MAG TPA: hypothetical protein VJN69_04825 [Candidatus Acidoferrales bacterium]|nr:hypothetical protein [Candidatus Acidoferrales bacterium]